MSDLKTIDVNVVVCSADSQYGGAGLGRTVHARGTPSLLSFQFRRIGTSFDWVNGSVSPNRASLIE